MLQWNYRDVVIKLKEYLRLPASKIEGSFAGDIIQAVSIEFTRIYAYLFSIKEQAYIDTAQGKYLDRLAFLFNIHRKKSIKATGIVTFEGQDGAVIREGTLLASESMIFKTLEEATIEEGSADARVEALTGGSNGNVIAGRITRFAEDTISGIDKITNKENMSGGARRETDTGLRERVYFRIRNPITSGNKYQYVEWALSHSGVGKVRVYPLWNGAGTVKVSIIDDNYKKASPELMQNLKDYLDPNDGKGDGVAPVGAVVTVSTATEVPINISFSLTYKTNAVEEDVKASIKERFADYLKDIGYSDRQVISYAQIGYIIMTTSGVDDYSALTINGITDNIRLQDEQVALLKQVIINGQSA